MKGRGSAASDTPERIEDPRELESRRRVFPIGAEVRPGGGVHFRVWAPKARWAAVELSDGESFQESLVEAIELEPERHGYFSILAPEAKAGTLYKFRLENGSFPDPVSRCQPEGPQGPSRVVDPRRFSWTDHAWKGVSRSGQVVYEMHIGTFTREGTWAAAAAELDELKRLGVTLIEMMPVAEFPGRFGWGYDGVDLFAPTRLYGNPDDLRKFVDHAHHLGLGVILDVVYNHIGPDGNHLKNFSNDYFTDRYSNEWGEAINFDGEASGPVREFFVANAVYWIQEFHFDGLRLDATQQIFDASPTHVLEEITQAVREAGHPRATYLVSENESQQTRLARPRNRGGYGMDALWNDDFHHSSRVALTGRNEAYYTDYRGTPQELVSAAKRGFLFQGQWSSWQRTPRGAPALDLAPDQFVTFIENHDQVANSLLGARLHQLASPGGLRAMTALLLLGPGTPMLFQGQEFAASAPFLFFADHHPELARSVVKGRRDFLRQFPSVACPESDPYLASPVEPGTFLRCKLDFSERQKHSGIYQLHKDLLKLRREDPVFARPQPGRVDGAVLGPEALVLRFFGEFGDDRLLLLNLGVDLKLAQAPEPLLAPVENASWRVLWSSESTVYGGGGAPEVYSDGVWRIPGLATVVLAAHHL